VKRLESIELRRPIETVPAELQDAVAESRRWVREEFAQPSFVAELQREATTDSDVERNPDRDRDEELEL